MLREKATVSGVGTSLLERPLGWRRSWLGMDRDEQVIAFARTARGGFLLHLAYFALLLVVTLRLEVVAGALVVLLACALWPERRMFWIGSSGVAMLFLRPFRTTNLAALSVGALEGAGSDLEPRLAISLVVASLLILVLILLRLVARDRGSLFSRRPIACSLLAFFGLVALASSGRLGGTLEGYLWAFIAVTASAFWRVAYVLSDRRGKDPTPDPLRLGFLRPYWGGTPVPIGKGPAYLRSFQARDSSELAVTRLKGLKLCLWAMILGFLESALRKLLERWELPTLEEAMALHFSGQTPAVAVCWASLVTSYTTALLHLAATGHAVVSLVRMTGFRIPRNTVRPLSARSLAEYWNRYYFYFKELLVDFFFFPAFLRFFKRHRRARLAWATFCSAGIGNCLYHFMREIDLVARLGPLGALRAFSSYAFYSLVLSAGLVISQLRKSRPQPSDGWWRYEFWPRFSVVLFFLVMFVFDDLSGDGTLAQRFTFLRHLAG